MLLRIRSLVSNRQALGRSFCTASKSRHEDVLASAAAWLNDSKHVLVAAGAGMGVDSGLPDFRGSDGFWKAYPPFAARGLRFADVANPRWFHEDPSLAWGFYGHRLHLYRTTTPHEGVDALLQLVTGKSKSYFVFTSNVDGAFQKAGYDPNSIVEIHGSIHHLQLGGDIMSADDVRVDVDPDTFRARGTLPIGRPNVLMFQDMEWISTRTDTQESRYRSWLTDVIRSNEKLAVVELGAGKDIATVRGECERVCRRAGSQARLLRINLRDADIPRSVQGFSLPMAAKSALVGIKNALQ